MTLQAKGEIHKIGEVQYVSDNFSKRELILKTDAETNFPQYVKFETSNIKNTLLDTFKVGEIVTIDFDLNGKLYKESAFNTNTIWKITKN